MDNIDNPQVKARNALNDKDVNSKGSKEAPLLTKGMAISFGFKRRVLSAPVTKIQPPSSTLDNSIYNIDRNANKFALTEKSTKPEKKIIEDNRKTIPRPSSLTNKTESNVFTLPRKKNKDNQKTVRFSSLEPKIQRNSNTAIKIKPYNNNAVSPPASKFTLFTSNLPKPQIPVHIVNLKSSKTIVNSNKQKSEQTIKSKAQEAKEIFMTNDLYKQLNVKVETVPLSATASKVHARKIDFLTNRLESYSLNDKEDPYYSLPTTLNDTLITKQEPPPKPSRYKLPSTRFKATTNITEQDNENNFSSLGFKVEESLDQSKNEFKNPHNSPQKLNRPYTAHNIYSNINKYEKPPEIITNNILGTENNRQRTFPKTQPPKNFLTTFKYPRNTLFTHNNDVLCQKLGEYNWDNAGETMADDASCSFSSSDESKEKDACDIDDDKLISPSDDDGGLLSIPPCSLSLAAKDPAFAAVAKSTDAVGNLLEDESPADSLFCSLSEENGKIEAIVLKNKAVNSSSDKSSPSEEKASPNTPTNGSNSLSLSDGKDFLIDDEIADQPALLFNKHTNLNNKNTSLVRSEDQELSPRKERTDNYQYGSYEHCDHTMFLKGKKLTKKTSSLDTLSPCESISSDDLMMNYDNLDMSEYDDNESTEKDIISTRILKPKQKTLTFSPKHSCSPIPHARVTEVKLFSSPKRCTQIDLSDHSSIESSQIICNPDIVQDVSSFREMLTRLRGVLLEFETPPMIENGAAYVDNSSTKHVEEIHNYKMENTDLRRQILFLQGQLEDTEKALNVLQENKTVAPVPQPQTSGETSNVATQTEKERFLTSSRSFMHISHHKDDLGSILRFKIGDVVLVDILLGICVLCAVNLLCLISLLYSCTTCYCSTVDDYY